MSRPLINSITANMGANSTAQVSTTGRYILILTAVAGATLQIDGGLAIPIIAGLAIPCDGPFTNLMFNDTSGGANIVTALVAVEPIQFFPPQTTTINVDAPTGIFATTYRVGGNGGGQLGANTTVAFSGLSPAGFSAGAGKQRKWISICNEGAGAIEVWDAGNHPGQTIAAGATQAYPVSGPFSIRNPNGAAQNVTVLECFYLTH